jgi:hypothetical protein
MTLFKYAVADVDLIDVDDDFQSHVDLDDDGMSNVIAIFDDYTTKLDDGSQVLSEVP